MMERNINKKYLEIHKKKDLPGNKMSIRNRFTYYPLYDVDKNSYIRRYRLWLKYKGKCIKENRPFVDVKQYGKILYAISNEIKHQLSIDQDGVVFKAFKVRVATDYKKRPMLQVKNRQKKKGILSMKDWGIFPARTFKDKLKALYKQNKLIDFAKLKSRHYRTIADKLDIFDEF
jgi:hypothetical protein